MENDTNLNTTLVDPGDEPAGRPLPRDPDALLHTVEAAWLLALSPRTLEALRFRSSEGPPFLSLGRRAIRYRRQDLLNWAASRQRRSTSEARPMGEG